MIAIDTIVTISRSVGDIKYVQASTPKLGLWHRCRSGNTEIECDTDEREWDTHDVECKAKILNDEKSFAVLSLRRLG